MKKCPFCAESIQEEAKKCRHCGEWLGEKASSQFDTNEELAKKLNTGNSEPKNRRISQKKPINGELLLKILIFPALIVVIFAYSHLNILFNQESNDQGVVSKSQSNQKPITPATTLPKSDISATKPNVFSSGISQYEKLRDELAHEAISIITPIAKEFLLKVEKLQIDFTKSSNYDKATVARDATREFKFWSGDTDQFRLRGGLFYETYDDTVRGLTWKSPYIDISHADPNELIAIKREYNSRVEDGILPLKAIYLPRFHELKRNYTAEGNLNGALWAERGTHNLENYAILEPHKGISKERKEEKQNDLTKSNSHNLRDNSTNSTKEDPTIFDEKKALLNSYFGDFRKGQKEQKSGETSLEVWEPYVKHMSSIASRLKAGASWSGTRKLNVVYDEIWTWEDDRYLTASERERSGPTGIVKLFWKNNQIRAVEVRKPYSSNPVTGETFPTPTWKTTDLYDRSEILKEIGAPPTLEGTSKSAPSHPSNPSPPLTEATISKMFSRLNNEDKRAYNPTHIEFQLGTFTRKGAQEAVVSFVDEGATKLAGWHQVWLIVYEKSWKPERRLLNMDCCRFNVVEIGDSGNQKIWVEGSTMERGNMVSVGRLISFSGNKAKYIYTTGGFFNNDQGLNNFAVEFKDIDNDGMLEIIEQRRKGDSERSNIAEQVTHKFDGSSFHVMQGN